MFNFTKELPKKDGVYLRYYNGRTEVVDVRGFDIGEPEFYYLGWDIGEKLESENPTMWSGPLKMYSFVPSVDQRYEIFLEDVKIAFSKRQKFYVSPQGKIHFAKFGTTTDCFEGISEVFSEEEADKVDPEWIFGWIEAGYQERIFVYLFQDVEFRVPRISSKMLKSILNELYECSDLIKNSTHKINIMVGLYFVQYVAVSSARYGIGFLDELIKLNDNKLQLMLNRAVDGVESPWEGIFDEDFAEKVIDEFTSN